MIYEYSINDVTETEYDALLKQRREIIAHIVESINTIYKSTQSSIMIPPDTITFGYSLAKRRIDLKLKRGTTFSMFTTAKDLTSAEEVLAENLYLTLEERLHKLREKK